jgi:hypothetical protein
VTYNGSTYICYLNGMTAIAPDSGNLSWELFVEQGNTGPTGDTGPTGSTGPTGEAYVNIDGGSPTSVYGGITSLDGGELT